MKKITLLVAICMTLISLSGFAQGMGGGMGGGMGSMGGGSRQGGMGQGGPQQSTQQRSVEINFIGASGYIEIDAEEALKKIKIKKNPKKAEEITAIIEEYNTSFHDVVDEYRSDFDNLEFAKENIDAAEGDMIAMRDLMRTVTTSMRVVKPLMIEKHKILVERMNAVLADSAKELKGWEKYYKSICKDNSFDPDAPERETPERGEGGQGQGGQGGGRPPQR